MPKIGVRDVGSAEVIVRAQKRGESRGWALPCEAISILCLITSLAASVPDIASAQATARADSPVANSSRAASDSERAFLEWTRSSLVRLPELGMGPPWDDLASLGNAIGDARIVALADNAACGAERMKFRNRLFRYLVEKKGFTTIAIESGVMESRGMGDYVRGGPGKLADVVADGIGRSADELPQEGELLRWMRSYNTEKSHPRKINFYGIDLPGLVVLKQNDRADVATTEVLKYLRRVDARMAEAFEARLPRYKTWGEGNALYAKLGHLERDAITAALVDLLGMLERHEVQYKSVTGTNDYEWAHQAVVAAMENDQVFRQVPISATGEIKKDDVGENIRDRGMFENLEWILKREGRNGKVLVFLDNDHAAKVPVERGYMEEGNIDLTSVGTYLNQEYGRKYFSIGSVIGSGPIYRPTPSGQDCTVTQYWPSTQTSIDVALGRLHQPRFFLDIRFAPPAAAWWLAAKRHLGPDGSFGLYNVPVGQAFDALVYLDVVTPARLPAP